MLSKLCHALLYSSISLLVAAFSSPFPPESSHKCYFIDGSYDPDGGPCFGNVGASMCCYSGENCYPGSALCLAASPNGPVGPNDNGSSIWRRSCTDFTWQDPACLAIAYDVAVESAQLSGCSDGTFCPRTDKDMNTTCCDDHKGQLAVLGHARIPESVVSSIRATVTSTASSAPHTDSSTSSVAPATASQTTASTSASTSAPTPASISLSASAAGLGQSAKIGIGVGISFGTLLVALLSFIAFLLYRNSQSNSPNLGIAEEAAPETKNLKEKNVNTGLQQRHELTGAESLKEMYTPHNTHEIEATSGASELWNSGLDG